jgi:hypothetical protein
MAQGVAECRNRGKGTNRCNLSTKAAALPAGRLYRKLRSYQKRRGTQASPTILRAGHTISRPTVSNPAARRNMTPTISDFLFVTIFHSIPICERAFTHNEHPLCRLIDRRL